MNKEERINQIEKENSIWVIYIIIIAASYISNYFEKNFFITNNEESKTIYRIINFSIFAALLIIYGYFESQAYNELLKKNKTKQEKRYDYLAFIATTLVLISGIIFLYLIADDKNLQTEIAFT